MTGLTDSPEESFEALRICERILGERQLAVLTLESLIEGERPVEDDEDGPSQGWPREAARCAEKSFLDNSVGLGRLRQSTLQVPTWPVGVGCLHSLPYRQCVSDRCAAVSSLALSPLASSEPLVQSHLLMWSSLRRPWPSSSCVRGGWGASETERRVGVRRRTSVRGSRETRLDERDGLRFRCDLIQSEGHTPSGSRGGRVVPLWRRIICDRHDSGLSPGKGWHSQKRCSVAR